MKSASREIGMTERPDIYILTGPVGSGKSTLLLRLREKKRFGSVRGIVTPMRNKTKRLVDLKTGLWGPFEGDRDRKDGLNCIRIGRFSLKNAGLAAARRILREGVSEDPDWLVVDEVGFLELVGLGLEPVLGQVIVRYQQGGMHGRLLLVVRDFLKDIVIRHYRLSSVGRVREPLIQS